MTFKYLQLNIWFGGKLWDNLITFLKEEDADIIALQEVIGKNPEHPDQNRFNIVENLQNELGLEYAFFAPTFYSKASPYDKIMEADWGDLIMSRYPIIETDKSYYIGAYDHINLMGMTDYSKKPHSIATATIDIHGTKVTVNSIHGVWGFDDKDNELRYKMSRAIIEKLKEKRRAILSGDLNTDQHTQAVQNIEHVAHNIFKDKFKTTFNMKHKPQEGGFKSSVIDFVFATHDLHVVNAYSSDKNVSDHVPLIVEFEI